MTRIVGIMFASLALLALGLMIVMSASNTFSSISNGDPFYLFYKQLVFVAVGVVFLFIFAVIPYQIYKSVSIYLLIAGILMLLLTLFVEQEVKGARRSIDLVIFSFQPVEFVKLALFIHLCAMIEKMGERIKSFEKGIVFILIWLAIVLVILLLQPNFSSIIMLSGLTFLLLFLAGARLKHLAAMGFSVFVVAGFMGYFFLDHVATRFDGYFNWLFGKGKPHPQIEQAIVALGTGNWQGIGFGGSRQKNLFLSEAHSDFIFAVLGEETGLIGTLAVLGFYLLIFIFGMIIAKNAKDRFGKLLGSMISLMIIFYTFVNVAVTIGIFPPTGFALPLMSYGGSAIIMTCISLGILMNIGFSAYKEAPAQENILSEGTK